MIKNYDSAQSGVIPRFDVVAMELAVVSEATP
jgi:hypothetical protein